jgi:hypothetical protein
VGNGWGVGTRVKVERATSNLDTTTQLKANGRRIDKRRPDDLGLRPAGGIEGLKGRRRENGANQQDGDSRIQDFDLGEDQDSKPMASPLDMEPPLGRRWASPRQGSHHPNATTLRQNEQQG